MAIQTIILDNTNKDLFKDVDEKFWQVVKKEQLLFEINNKFKRKENVLEQRRKNGD